MVVDQFTTFELMNETYDSYDLEQKFQIIFKQKIEWGTNVVSIAGSSSAQGQIVWTSG